MDEFKLHFCLDYLGFPFCFGSQFWGFFCLVLILCFEAKLMLETCRKHLLKENPSFFWFFGTQLMGFRKLGFLMVLHLCVFVQFFGQDWWINVWGWKTGCLHRKLHNFWPNFFSSLDLFSPNQVCSAHGENDDVIMTSSWHH